MSGVGIPEMTFEKIFERNEGKVALRIWGMGNGITGRWNFKFKALKWEHVCCVQGTSRSLRQNRK